MAEKLSEAGICKTCMGNGELVTDWALYLHGPLDESGNDAVRECQNCDGTGRALLEGNDNG